MKCKVITGCWQSLNIYKVYVSSKANDTQDGAAQFVTQTVKLVQMNVNSAILKTNQNNNYTNLNCGQI